MQKFLFVAFIFLLVSGCGRKGVLIPPEAMVPAPISDLRVTQSGERFLVSWSQPTREQGGGPLKDLAGFRVFRREVLPPGEDCEECVAAYKAIMTVDPDYLQEVSRSGNLYSFFDTDLTAGKTYQYKVISFNEEGAESKQSNLARRTKVIPPQPPVVRVSLSGTQVVLAWEPVNPPPQGSVVGYLVYRKQGIAPFAPITGKPLPATTYEDLGVTPGKSYVYTVRTVARAGGETVESEPSAQVTARPSPGE